MNQNIFRYNMVDAPVSNVALGLDFWQNVKDPRVLCSTYRTNLTPNWCDEHEYAHDAAVCPGCRDEAIDGIIGNAERQIKDMAKRNGASTPPKGTKEITVKVAIDGNVIEFKRNRLIDCEREIDRLIAKKREASAEWSTKLKEEREQRASLLTEIESGRQEITVDVIERRDDRRGCMLVVRADTGAVVDERPMTNAERQLDLEESIRQKQEAVEKDAKADGLVKLGRGSNGSAAKPKPKAKRKGRGTHTPDEAA